MLPGLEHASNLVESWLVCSSTMLSIPGLEPLAELLYFTAISRLCHSPRRSPSSFVVEDIYMLILLNRRPFVQTSSIAYPPDLSQI